MSVMKRLTVLALLCVASLFCAAQLSAQKYGVSAGATFSSLKGIENSAKTGWNVGGTVQFNLPLGFSIQPSLIYNSKVTQVDVTLGRAGLDVGYLELPISVQWGPDLLIFRPFLDVSPYVGYALSSKISAETLLTSDEWKTSNLQRFEYGLGLGGGIEVWRFQLICRYNWNFGSLVKDDGKLNVPHLEDAFRDRNFGGVTLSLAFLFGK